MCTILTFDRKLFRQHEDEIVGRITQDALTNSDGSSLILIGKTKNKVVHLRTMDAGFICRMLIDDDEWERAWVHNRMATTSFKGLVGAHGFHGRFRGDDWYLMHNGVFHHKDAKYFNVDSEWMMSLLNDYGPEAALKIIEKNETYANIFLICPTEGKWTMMRQNGGSLHTDGQGNYSTNEIKGIIDTTVATGTSKDYKFEVTWTPAYDRWRDSRSAKKGDDDKEKKSTTPASSSGGASTTTGSTTQNTTGTSDVTVTSRTDRSGKAWRRSSASGLWYRVEDEVTYVRRVVS